MTHADVLEAVTLGETDLFRALQRAPGVAARDDYGADFWVRGGAWDQTRVYFDGLPLFNPVHGFGLLSAVNTDAIGGALLHPGVRSASLGEGAAAVLDVTSRVGGAAGEMRGLADLSLASGRLALDGGAMDGRAAWMIAGRRSWLDLATGVASVMADDPSLALPYSFSDLTARFDLQLGEGRAVETSALYEHDHIDGTLPDILHRTRATWGNGAGRITYVAPLGQLQTRTTLGVSRYGSRVREAEPDPEAEDGMSAAQAGPSDNRLLHLSLGSELSPDAGARVRPWRLGYGVVREVGGYEGPEGYAYGGYRVLDADSMVERRGAVARAHVWGERRWGDEQGLSVETGLRLEAGDNVENGGVVRASPRLTARFAPSPDVALSAGMGRSYQYSQALAAVEPIVASGHAASHIWLLADEETPAIRADVATLGAEWWVGQAWLLVANGYARRATGLAVPDPTPGPLEERPRFTRATNDATGLELSARRLAGRWTASGSYSLARSTQRAAGLSYPAPEDRRHSFDVTSMLRLGGGLRTGMAFTHASGAPYTRVHAQSSGCSAGSCRAELLLGQPGAHRSGDYSSLDLLLDWTNRFRGWDLGVYLQVRNVLGHRNDVTWTSTYQICSGVRSPETGACEGATAFQDSFQTGLPRLPLLGFRARF
jgi:hypothetical protein